MKTNKPRNRESRTKPIPTESSVAIRLRRLASPMTR